MLNLLLSGTVIAADIATLAFSDGWKRLVHYDEDIFSPSGFRSAIHSPEFFLSERGAQEPATELKATLAAMLQPVPGDTNLHGKCRFPARLIWLRRHFPEHQKALEDIACPDFSEWMPLKDIESASLVFANGYLGNPASYYGHVFLKFNRRAQAQAGSHLVDQTANYGAIDTVGDDPLSYIFKGVTGGYDGAFTAVDFFFHESTYNENELRDLWEYRLDLAPEEAHYLAAHVWEILKKRYVYYFFHDNCAYRVAELLEIIEGIEAIPRARPWVVPQAVIQKITQSRYQGRPLVGQRIFHPSRQTRLYERFADLNSEERNLVSALVEKRAGFNAGTFQTLSLDRKHAVIDVLLDYHQFRNSKKEGKYDGKLPPEYVEALSVRLKLPPGKAGSSQAESTPPDAANSPSWTQLGISHRQSKTAVTTFRLRPAYYDSLDVSEAQAKNGGLSMGELFLEIDGHSVHLTRLDLVAIDSVNPSVTGLPGDRGFGWRLRAGVEQAQLGCTNCLIARAQGDYTWGDWIGSPKLFGALHVGGALQEQATRDGFGFGRVSFSLTARSFGDFSFRYSQEIRQPFDLLAKYYSVTTVELRKALGKDYDLRGLWERESLSRFTVGIGHYW